jgi:CubicO group peptidase (beta-lactamase class C family)
MKTNQSGTLHSTTGLGFGYGFETVDRYGAKELAGVGAFGWGGAYGTTYQVDPQSGLVIVLMMQLMPNTTDLHQKVPCHRVPSSGGLRPVQTSAVNVCAGSSKLRAFFLESD